MSSIISDSFRRNTTQQFIDSIIADDDVYVGIGKSDPYYNSDTATVPDGTIAESIEALRNLSALVKVDGSDIRRIIPCVYWLEGEVYKAYDQNDANCFYATNDSLPCYAINNGYVYLCLVSPGTATSNAPTAADYDFHAFADNYTWVLVTRIEPASPFDTTQFTAVVKDSRIGDGVTIAAATKGAVYTYNIANGGTNYTNSAVVTLVGAGGDDLVLTKTVVNGVITRVSNPGSIPYGYSSASVTVYENDVTRTSEGEVVNAQIIPSLTPIAGFGENPENALPTWFAGVGANIANTMGGDASLSSYRQISLIKAPGSNGEDNDLSSLDTLRYIILTADGSACTAENGSIIVGTAEEGDEPAMAFYDGVETVGGTEYRMYYHQNNANTINIKPFASGGGVLTVYAAEGGAIFGEVEFTGVGDAEYVYDSGELLFLENRAKISRDAAQTEEIKLVIQF
jgi:hypothetical protein